MNDRNHDSIGGMGASARPGDICRGLRVVQRGLGQLIDDAEAYHDALREAYWSRTNDERVSEEGMVIGEALDKAIALLGLLNGAAHLSRDLAPRFTGSDYTGL